MHADRHWLVHRVGWCLSVLCCMSAEQVHVVQSLCEEWSYRVDLHQSEVVELWRVNGMWLIAAGFKQIVWGMVGDNVNESVVNDAAGSQL